MLVWETREFKVGYHYEKEGPKWWVFKHCPVCHRPLLDLSKTYTTADELESKVRAKILERQLQENV